MRECATGRADGNNVYSGYRKEKRIMQQTAISFDGAGQGMIDVMEADGTRGFYNVSDFLADLRGGKFADVSTVVDIPPAEFVESPGAALGLPVYVPFLRTDGVISGRS